MFARTVIVSYVAEAGSSALECPIHWIDNFAMRNFTNDAIFDDTLPISDGRLEIGYRVPLEKLQSAMADWFRRKGYLKAGADLILEERVSDAIPLSGPETA